MLDSDERRSVLFADSHSLFRKGMRYLLQEILPNAAIVEAGSRAETIASLESGCYDLVLAGLFSGEGDWERFLVDLVRWAPAGKLLIISGIEDPAVIRRVLAAGAAGYILKETAPEIMLQAIRLVLAGGIYIPPAALGFLPRSGAHEEFMIEATDGVQVTERQHAVLQLLAQGASNKEIAQSLDLSPGAVKAHVASLLRIYGADNRTELAIIAARRGAGIRGQRGSERRRPE